MDIEYILMSEYLMKVFELYPENIDYDFENINKEEIGHGRVRVLKAS